jgi:hypothetical protein
VGVSERPAVIGLRAHSGWAALVAVAGDLAHPEVVHRARVEMADGPLARQPYHAVEGRPVAEAARRLDAWAKEARTRAARSLGDVVAALRAAGCAPGRVVLLAAVGRPLPALAAILASHALIHTADGEHFRTALTLGAADHGLLVQRAPERDLPADARRRLGLGEVEVEQRMTAWRKQLGPPWTADQKLSALAAWASLAYS